MSRYTLSVTLCALVLGAALDLGCSSASSTPMDARADAAADAADAALVDSAQPLDARHSLLAKTCSALQTFVSKCKAEDACSVAQAKSCPSFMSRYSDGYLSAVAACGGGECAPAGECIAAHENAVRPTATQEAVKVKYCAVCPSDCDTFFVLSGTGDGKEDGVGAAVRHASEEAVSRIESACVAPLTPSGCGVPFFFCSLAVGEDPILPECEDR